ncbi:hypothetical protein CE195_04780 [Sodalis-like symbiont of Philaenus spumarius]|nr:hypothetical protein CE195_04780 [Sodalis-like symbiont of Philaenus spumarius]
MHCPRCHSDEIYRHGLSPTQRECFRCQCCRRVFQLTYRYEARKPGVKERASGYALVEERGTCAPSARARGSDRRAGATAHQRRAQGAGPT